MDQRIIHVPCFSTVQVLKLDSRNGVLTAALNEHDKTD
jgi:hypothetical protein